MIDKKDIRKALFGISTQEDFKIKRVMFIVILTLLCVSFNYFGSVFAESIVFPLYLDSWFTFAVVAIGGLVPGIVCALLSNLILTVFANVRFTFVLCHISTVILTWLVFIHKSEENEKKIVLLEKFLWAGILSALSNGLLGNIISDLMYSSVPGTLHSDIVVQGIYMAVPNRIFATYVGGFLENLTDKIISALVSYGLILFIHKRTFYRKTGKNPKSN